MTSRQGVINNSFEKYDWNAVFTRLKKRNIMDGATWPWINFSHTRFEERFTTTVNSV